MLRELINATEGGSLKALEGELFGRVMGEGSTVSEAVAGARAAFRGTAETVGLTSKPSLAGTTSYSDFAHLAKSDLVAQTVKKIGSDHFSVSEYTRLANAQKLSGPAIGADEHFSMAEVKRIIDEAHDTYGLVPLQVVGNDGREIKLSGAGARVYASATETEEFVRGLSDGIKHERWSAVIGDDVSGRIPSMQVWDQMQRWAHHRNLTAPQMYFMASGRKGVGDGFSQEARIENLARRMEEEGLNSHSGRAVIVSEIVATGDSLTQLMRALERHKIPFDVAAMSSSHNEESLHQGLSAAADVRLFQSSSGGRMYAGGAGSGSEFRESIGVEKYGAEATSRLNLRNPASVDLLRKEIAPLGRYTFEKVFQ